MNHYFKTNRKKLTLVLYLFFLVFYLGYTGYGQEAEKKIDLTALDRYIESSRAVWKIPGVAVAVVKDGKIILSRGYGVKEFSKPDKVDENTLFAIASNSKAFTAATLAVLVEEGKLKWDDPVRKYLPYFKLYDPYVSEEMRVRDLLCHRSGLGTFSGDLLWYHTPYSTAEVVKRASYLKPAMGFRTGYGYSNLMFMAASEVAAAASGMEWKTLVKEKFFKPLGMETTNVGIEDLKKYSNVSTPHYINPEGKTLTISYTPSDSMSGAGAINSNVREMANWLVMLLDGGVFNNKQLLKKESIDEMWTPHISRRLSPFSRELFKSTHFATYGLGWELSDYEGYKIVSHSGALDGMISRVGLVPEMKLGIVILTNSINSFPNGMMYYIIDTFRGVKPRDWNKIYLDRISNQDKKDVEAQKEAQAALLKKIEAHRSDQIDLNDFAGKYNCEMYGDVSVKNENGKLVLNFEPAPVFISDLVYTGYDTFHISLRNDFSFIPSKSGTAQFTRDFQQNVVGLKVDIPNGDFFFTELEFKKIKNTK